MRRGRPSAAEGAPGDRDRSWWVWSWRASFGRRSGVCRPIQALELAAETLAWPALPADRHDRRPCLAHDRRAVVHVARRGDGGSDTRLDGPHDFDDAVAVRDAGL